MVNYQDQTFQKKNGKSVVEKVNIKQLKILVKNTSPTSYHVSVFFPYFVTFFPISLFHMPSHCPSSYSLFFSHLCPPGKLIPAASDEHRLCGRGCPDGPQD